MKCQNFEIIILRNRADREKYLVSQVLLKLNFVHFCILRVKDNSIKIYRFHIMVKRNKNISDCCDL